MSERLAAARRIVLASFAVATSACGAQVVFVDDGQGQGGATVDAMTGATSPAGGGGEEAFYCVLGPYTRQCFECEATDFRCTALEAQCHEACDEYIDCVFACESDPSCCAACASDNLEGARQYSALVSCVACDACADTCGETAPGFCAR